MPCQRVAKILMHGFHYKLALVLLYLYQMLGPPLRVLTVEASSGCCLWLKASCDSHGWLSKSVIPKNEQCKQATGLLRSWPKLSPTFFLDAKGKTHGLPNSSRVGANKNRTVPLMSITSLGFDFHFLLPKLNAGPLSAVLCLSPLFFSPSKLWIGNTLFGGGAPPLCLNLSCTDHWECIQCAFLKANTVNVVF